jgi:hypothetical protein
VTAGRPDTVVATDDASLTVVFKVANDSPDSIDVAPSLAIPDGWTVLTGSSHFRLAPRSRDLWLVSVAPSSRARAGVYLLRGTIEVWGHTAADSVHIRVNQRRGVEVLSAETPSWVMAGKQYQARFLVRNRGNVEASFALKGSTSRGARTTVDMAVVTLTPGATALATVRVPDAGAPPTAADDIIELFAVDQTDTTVRASASSRTTVIPQAPGMFDGLNSIPAQLSLRAAVKQAVVSPVTLVGAGRLGESQTTVEFSLHAKPGPDMPSAFGEREEYRFRAHSPNSSLQLGDDWFGFTPLTAGASMGRGAQIETNNTYLRAGAYVQHVGSLGAGPLEEGFLLATPRAPHQLGLVVLRRSTAAGAARVASVNGETAIPLGASLALESASSDSVGTRGQAGRARLAGGGRALAYDLTYQKGSSGFAGLLRGISTKDGLLSAELNQTISLRAYAGLTTSANGGSSNDSLTQRSSTGSLSATFRGATTLEYGFLGRDDDGAESSDGVQHGVRLSSSRGLGKLFLNGNIQRGVARETSASASRQFTALGGSAAFSFGTGNSLSIFLDRQDGRQLNASGQAVLQGGATADLQLPGNFWFSTFATATSATNASVLVPGAQFQYGRIDLRLEHPLPNGATLALRAQLWQQVSSQPASTPGNAMYLEYRTAIRVPVGRRTETGVASGTVVDAATGSPIRGALVRIGEAAAFTDVEGRANFSGLDSGRYRVSLDPSGVAAGAMLMTNEVVEVGSKATTRSTFAVAITRGARLSGIIHLMDFKGTVGRDADSLIEVGVLSNVVVALEGARDTLYQTTDDRGRMDFGAVQPGRWRISVSSDALPDNHILQSDSIVVALVPGEERVISLRAIPQRRGVIFVGGETELRSDRSPHQR